MPQGPRSLHAGASQTDVAGHRVCDGDCEALASWSDRKDCGASSKHGDVDPNRKDAEDLRIDRAEDFTSTVMARRNQEVQIARLAEEYLNELEGHVLEVVLIPSRDDDCALRGGMIRCVQMENAKWYRRFAAKYESVRKDRLRYRNKFKTKIKRQHTIRGLRELMDGRCKTIYAHRLKRAIRNEQREYEREHLQ